MSSNKLLYQIALTQIHGVGDVLARNLLDVAGSAEAIFQSSRKSLLAIKGFSSKLVDEILNPEVLKKAESELAFIEKNSLQTYFINEENYPHRLRDCYDAPILLYYKGEADFNTEHIISIVGTRNPTNYGNEFCETFLRELSDTHPDTLIISGLAYGIDIQTHRCALKYGFRTIGILAHGLDRIYPSNHRQTAVDMIAHGGLLTEFTSKTEPEKYNFVRRNRIVAGMADAIIVVESNEKGGSLITAEVGSSYCRDIFATPGRLNDPKSKGCNKLIATHKADLLLSTSYFLEQMGWNEENLKGKKLPKQRELFLNLNSEEQMIIDILNENGSTHVDQLTNKTGIPSHQLFSILLEMELKELLINLPGNMYTLK